MEKDRIVKIMQDKGLISKIGNRYFSACARWEEITIEINELIDELKGESNGKSKI